MKKILLLGEHCLDIYHYGKCNRLNPEAPVQILDQESEKRLEGMSSNVKNNLISFEFNVDHFKNKEHLEKHRLIDTTYKQHLIRYDIGDLPVREFNLDNLKDTYDYVVCGAGDVFLSSIVFGFAKYGSIERSIELANIFASFSVNKLGTYVLSKGDIKQLQYESL